MQELRWHGGWLGAGCCATRMALLPICPDNSWVGAREAPLPWPRPGCICSPGSRTTGLYGLGTARALLSLPSILWPWLHGGVHTVFPGCLRSRGHQPGWVGRRWSGRAAGHAS